MTSSSAVVVGLLTEFLVVRPIDVRAPGHELPALIAVVAVLFALLDGVGLQQEADRQPRRVR